VLTINLRWLGREERRGKGKGEKGGERGEEKGRGERGEGRGRGVAPDVPSSCPLVWVFLVLTVNLRWLGRGGEGVGERGEGMEEGRGERRGEGRVEGERRGQGKGAPCISFRFSCGSLRSNIFGDRGKHTRASLKGSQYLEEKRREK
jgi:hypothetical protein